MPKVEIYTRDYCGYCTRAKSLLGSKGLDFVEYNASRQSDHRAAMMKRSGRSTFPQVFIDNRHIGGSDELAAFARSGELDALIKTT